jgi:hypothetical protein
VVVSIIIVILTNTFVSSPNISLGITAGTVMLSFLICLFLWRWLTYNKIFEIDVHADSPFEIKCTFPKVKKYRIFLKFSILYDGGEDEYALICILKGMLDTKQVIDHVIGNGYELPSHVQQTSKFMAHHTAGFNPEYENRLSATLHLGTVKSNRQGSKFDLTGKITYKTNTFPELLKLYIA